MYNNIKLSLKLLKYSLKIFIIFFTYTETHQQYRNNECSVNLRSKPLCIWQKNQSEIVVVGDSKLRPYYISRGSRANYSISSINTLNRYLSLNCIIL